MEHPQHASLPLRVRANLPCVAALGAGLGSIALAGCTAILGDFSTSPAALSPWSDAGDAEGGSSPAPEGGRDATADTATGDTAIGDSAIADSATGADGAGVDGSRDDSSIGDGSLPTPDVVTAPDGCAAVAPDPSVAVFVASGGASASCGTEAAPCGSIQTAIGVAQTTSKPSVYIADGAYTESVILGAGISLRGGWIASNGSWVRDCSAHVASNVTIQAADGAFTTVLANSVGAVALDTLTVLSVNPVLVPASGSVYGIVASGTTVLTLNDVIVTTAAAGAGAPGTGAVAGSPGTNCTGTNDGASASPGGPGPGASAGSFASDGYHPSAGGSGLAGAAGDPGTGPTPPTCVSILGCTYVASAHTCQAPTEQSCGTTGSAGCGGAPAQPGSGGGGGGSSIPLFVWGATVTSTGGALTAGAGGNGGDGSPSAGGGAGTPGLAGNAGPYNIGLCSYSGSGTLCSVDNVSPGGAAGGAGGTGGTGASSGEGGGGAGGCSYTWYAGGGGSVTTSGTALTHGAAGSGGAGTNRGAPGIGADHN
jgi:hypothetical protein